MIDVKYCEILTKILSASENTYVVYLTFKLKKNKSTALQMPEWEWEWWTGNGREIRIVVWKKFPLVALVIFLTLYF